VSDYQKFANKIDKASNALSGKTVDKILAFEVGSDFYCVIFFTDGTSVRVDAWAYWDQQITGLNIGDAIKPKKGKESNNKSLEK
jgi:hypothetical protein